MPGKLIHQKSLNDLQIDNQNKIKVFEKNLHSNIKESA